jgi:hypothetical protein
MFFICCGWWDWLWFRKNTVISYIEIDQDAGCYDDKGCCDNEECCDELELNCAANPTENIDIRDETILNDNNLVLHDCLSIQIYNCPKITTIPNMYNYIALETLNIQHCNLNIFTTYLPESLRVLVIAYCNMTEFIPENMPMNLAELNLSFNKLTKIPTCLNTIQGTNVNLKNNDLWFNMYSKLPPSMIKPGVYKELALAYRLNLIGTLTLLDAISILRDKQLNEDANLLSILIDARDRTVNTGDNRGDNRGDNGSGNTTYNNAQNVHLTSVQKSMANSISYIMKYRFKYKDTDPEISEIDYIRKALRDINISKKLTKRIMKKCNDRIPHSIYNVNFIDVLISVFTIIYESELKDTLLIIMRDEVQDGINTCFTGQITRMVNVLNGFVDEIKISISNTEELSNSIIALRKRYALLYKDIDQYITETIPVVWQMLEDNCIPEPEHKMWLEYI